MPFTFSHPAAILPLNHFFKRKVSTTGLVAGSLVPDFEYFIRFNHQSFYSHTWGGLFYIDLPLGVLLCFLYHNLIREPFYANTPLAVKRKLAPFQSLRWNSWFAKKWFVVLFSLLVGAFSHLLWDKLTHHTVPLVQSASGFQHFNTEDDRAMAYFVFWDISSLIGAFFVFYAIWTLPSDQTVTANTAMLRYWLCLPVFAAGFLPFQLGATNVDVLDNVVIAVINSFFLSLVSTSVVFTFWPRVARKKLA